MGCWGTGSHLKGNLRNTAVVDGSKCYLIPWMVFMRNWVLNAIENRSCSESEHQEVVISLPG
jgi:hypothetical protein